MHGKSCLFSPLLHQKWPPDLSLGSGKTGYLSAIWQQPDMHQHAQFLNSFPTIGVLFRHFFCQHDHIPSKTVRYGMNISEFFLPPSPLVYGLWGRRQETGMFGLTQWRLLLDVWYPNKPLDWAAKRHFSQGSWEKQWYALLNTNSGPSWDERMDRGDGGMEVCREEKMFSVSSAQGCISQLEESAQPTENRFRCC